MYCEKNCYFCANLCYITDENVNSYFCTFSGKSYDKTQLIPNCDNYVFEMEE